jgi:hypothetical protein
MAGPAAGSAQLRMTQAVWTHSVGLAPSIAALRDGRAEFSGVKRAGSDLESILF